MGKSLVPMLVSLMGACVFRVVWVLTVFAANPQPDILYWSYPISWTLTASVHFICYLYVFKKTKEKLLGSTFAMN